MNLRSAVVLVVVLVAALIVGACTPTAGGDFPNKPVTMIVPWAAGAVPDVGTRLVTPGVSKILGQEVVVVNKEGASSQTGLQEVADAKPDGYTLANATFPRFNTIILDPSRKAKFDVDSFTHVISQVLDPGVIYVKADSPYKSLEQLIEAAKANPGKITAGGNTPLSDDHLMALMVQKAAGVQFRIVNFKGGDTEQVPALLGGHIEIAFDNAGTATPRVRTGEVRALAIADKERSKMLPDVATFGEKGYQNVVSSAFRSFLGPKGIPEAVVKKLEDAFKKTMAEQSYKDAMDKQGLGIKIMTGEDLKKYLKDMNERVKPTVEEALKTQ